MGVQQVDFLLAGILGNTNSTNFNGRPLTGGQVWFYQPGTTSEITVYKDADENTSWIQPVLLDSNGRALVFVGEQCDIKIKDADGIDIVTYGKMSYGGTAVGTGWKLLATASGGATTTEITFTGNITATYDLYAFALTDIIPGDNVNPSDELCMQVSTDGGSTWAGGASDYQYSQFVIETPFNCAKTAASGRIQINRGNCGSASGKGMSGLIFMESPATAARKTSFHWRTNLWQQGGAFSSEAGGGTYNTAGATNGVRFFMDQGDYISSGTIALYGISKS